MTEEESIATRKILHALAEVMRNRAAKKGLDVNVTVSGPRVTIMARKAGIYCTAEVVPRDKGSNLAPRSGTIWFCAQAFSGECLTNGSDSLVEMMLRCITRKNCRGCALAGVPYAQKV